MAEGTVANNVERGGTLPRWRRLLVLLALCAIGSAGAAVPPIVPPPSTQAQGLPFIRNFGPADYAGAPQNWAVAQTPDGVIYLGNVDDGLFSYDGARWQRIAIPNRSAVRSLAVDAHGRLWVGAVGDIGYLGNDAQGRQTFVSLLDQVPAADRDFTDVWRTFAAPDGVYFITRARILRVAGGKVTVWRPHTAFHMGFMVRGSIFVREIDRGLVQVTAQGLRLVPGGERFAQEKVYVLLPWSAPGMGPDAMLVGTRTQGWWLFDGQDYRRWSAEADRAVAGSMLYAGIWLADGRIAVVSPPAGLLLFDRDGHLLRRFDHTSGLPNDEVNWVFEDSQHGLWVTSDLGVSRIALDTPITLFDQRTGLRGAVLSLVRHDGRLYAGSTEGLFALRTEVAGGARFEPVLATPDAVWALRDTPHGLLAGGMHGVWTLSGGTPSLAWASDQTVFSLLRSQRDPARVFVGLQNGLASIRWDGTRWRAEGLIGGVSEEVRSMLEQPDGSLWLGSWNSHVLHVSFPPGWKSGTAARVRRFGAAEGLPVGQSHTIAINGDARFATIKGIYRYDEARERFEPDPRFATLFPGGPRQIGAAHQDRAGRLWMYTADVAAGLKESGVATADAQGRWHWSAIALRPMAGGAMTTLLGDANGVLWLAGEQQELFRFDPAQASATPAPFATLLRRVSPHDGSRLGGGAPGQRPELPHASNALRFEFAAPRYLLGEANRFQSQLQGLDAGWSDWTDEAYRDYTNLPEGDYRFRVRARDVYGQVGGEAGFQFSILPPWYRSWWAWLLWGALAALAAALVFRWRSAALHRRNRELAALVERRTTELQVANEALAEQTITDPLTGLKNRRYLHDHIEQDVALARRHFQERQHPPQALGLLFLMVDIDHFKEINDTYGHAAGDRVLQQFRDILLAVTRQSDTPVRWGGEEFLIVARFAPRDAGPQFAERIRATVASHRFDLGEGRRLHRTCSIGFASYPVFAAEPDQLNWEQVVNLADECLYAAKRHGRNAWAGVAPMDEPPQGNVIEALHASFARMPEPGPLRLIASWAELATA